MYSPHMAQMMMVLGESLKPSKLAGKERLQLILRDCTAEAGLGGLPSPLLTMCSAGKDATSIIDTILELRPELATCSQLVQLDRWLYLAF